MIGTMIFRTLLTSLILILGSSCAPNNGPDISRISLPIYPQDGEPTPVTETVNSALDRLRAQLEPEALSEMDRASLLEQLTPEEIENLSTQHLQFEVNQAVDLFILGRAGSRTPFWLDREGFHQLDEVVQVANYRFGVWQKEFEAGTIGLGINSLYGGGRHYLVAIRPKGGNPLAVTNLSPRVLETDRLGNGVKAWIDRDEQVEQLPDFLEDLIFIRTAHSYRDHGRLLQLFTLTRHPSQSQPDQITLTWSENPATTQTIQWRTDASVSQGMVAYAKKGLYHRFKPESPLQVKAQTVLLETPNIPNDSIIHRHTAVLTDLEPDTTYVYSIGDGSEEGWTELREFRTAPNSEKPFSFIYLGDAQNGLDRWGSLLQKAYQRHPEAAFYVMAGDIVNRGLDRDDWDSLFYNSDGIYDHRPIVPAIGNHDNQGGFPWLYLNLLELTANGPSQIDPGRVYSLRYSNALVVVLDSNLDPKLQTEWLEATLAASDAKWKFVTFHHPVYSSAPSRDNSEIRDSWVPIFDKYHVDMVFQGHDHAYLRTPPMRGNQEVSSPKEGTIYVVSFSGTKKYRQVERDYIEVGFTDTPTYQTLDIQTSGDRLLYRAYDLDGRLKDELVIEK